MTLRGLFALILFAALLPAPAVFAQDPTPTPNLSEVRKIGEAAYPDFIGSTPVSTATPSGEEKVEPAPQEEIEPHSTYERAMILVDDRASTTTWHQVRERLGSDLEDLRLLLISNATDAEVEAQRDRFLTGLDMILVMAPIQAPSQEIGLQHTRDRISKQIDFLAQRLEQGEYRLAETQDEMLRLSMEEFDALLFQSDLDRDSPPGETLAVPKDWDPRSFSTPRFAALIQGWSGQALLLAYEDRLDMIARDVGRDQYGNQRVAAEMGELARELATRLYEVPVSSRKGFRDAALRLDVLSETLADYMHQGNRLYAKRHIRFTREAVEDVNAYLRLKAANTGTD